MLVETKAKVGVFAIALGAYLPQFPTLVPEFEAQHATLFPAKPWDVADAGVQVISHAYMLEWEGVSEELSGNIFENYEKFYDKIDHEKMSVERFLQAVKQKGLIFDPTLFLCMENKMEWAARFVKRANQIGVKICAGTDYINDLNRPFPFLFDELDLYVEKCGFYPMEAIFTIHLCGNMKERV